MQKAMITLMFLLAIITGFLYYAFYSPENKITDEIIVEIPSGVSVKAIGKILEENKIINNANIFYYTVRILEKDYSVQAGKYVLYKNFGVFRTIEVLRQSPIIEDIAITIPEGLTIWQTAKITASVFENVDSSEFVVLCENAEFVKKFNIDGISTLEGYLYPETYRFPKAVKTEEIISRFVLKHKQVFAELPKSERAAKFTDRELVILASIVEAESKVAAERPRVAGVFYNRIEKNIPIGADATVRFAVKNFDRKIRRSELNSDSPYNTRKFKGLPAGAICSPGKTALFAALNPENNDYLFFMAKWDGSGEHIFTKTNAEHEKAKKEVIARNKHLKDF